MLLIIRHIPVRRIVRLNKNYSYLNQAKRVYEKWLDDNGYHRR